MSLACYPSLFSLATVFSYAKSDDIDSESSSWSDASDNSLAYLLTPIHYAKSVHFLWMERRHLSSLEFWLWLPFLSVEGLFCWQWTLMLSAFGAWAHQLATCALHPYISHSGRCANELAVRFPLAVLPVPKQRTLFQAHLLLSKMEHSFQRHRLIYLISPFSAAPFLTPAPLTPALITPFSKIVLTPIKAGVRRAPFSKISKFEVNIDF